MRRAALRRRRQVQPNDAGVGTSLGAAMGQHYLHMQVIARSVLRSGVSRAQRSTPEPRVFPSFGTLELAATREQTSDLGWGALQTRDPAEEERAGSRISGAALTRCTASG